MSDVKANLKPLPTLVLVVGLLISTASLTYAFTTGNRDASLEKKQETLQAQYKANEDKDNQQEIEIQVLKTMVSTVQSTLDKIENMTADTNALMQRHIGGGR
jgi:hypothetical protein